MLSRGTSLNSIRFLSEYIFDHLFRVNDSYLKKKVAGYSSCMWLHFESLL